MASKKKVEPFTHIDRSNRTFLKTSQLDKNKPHISPVSGTAFVEKLTDAEYVDANK